MGFLDNSGDIILDAVLTDLGRKRLAEGNGRFSVAKFALGDDEIDYGLYDKNAVGGTPYYDISILQTPVLEAFTNNMSSMKSRLMSYSENDLLYLPVIKINNSGDSALNASVGSYVVLVDETTVNYLKENNTELEAGLLNGNQPNVGVRNIQTDQGLDTNALPENTIIPPNLLESQYFIQIDNRLGFLYPGTGGSGASSAYTATTIDDDSIASYVFTSTGGDSVISNIDGEDSSIQGPSGTKVTFKIAASLSLRTSTYLFTQLGTPGNVDIANGSNTLTAASYRFIDSVVRVSGVSTGYTLDIPVRFVKKNP